jgi:hypothetical protein
MWSLGAHPDFPVLYRSGFDNQIEWDFRGQYKPRTGAPAA